MIDTSDVYNKERKNERMKLVHTPDKYGRFFDRCDLERIFFQDILYADIHLTTGDVITCRILEYGMYAIVAEMATKKNTIVKVLILKHSIEMIVPRELEETSEN